MADTEDDDEASEEDPTAVLGDGPAVEGAPLARVAARLTWPQEASAIRRKEGDAVIRTPDGPREVGAVLDEVDETYFDTRQSFVGAVRDVVGRGPVATADE
ncbi:MAG: DUF5789 family protein [Haloferacaceae archaeon]